MTAEKIYTGDIELPVQVCSEIWQKAEENSAVLALARHIDLPADGMAVPIIVGDPEAEWTDETANAPVDYSSFGVKTIKPYEITVIEPISKDFINSESRAPLYGVMTERLPKAIGKTLDSTVFGYGSGPGENFDTFADIEAYDIDDDAYAGLVTAKGAIADAGYAADGIALSPKGETALMAARDDVNRPLFIGSTAEGEPGRVLGMSTQTRKNVGVPGNAADAEHDIPAHATTVGFMGDWENAVVGIVSPIKLDFATEATLTKKDGTSFNLFQKRMIAVMASFKVGFAVKDEDAFARLTVPYSA